MQTHNTATLAALTLAAGRFTFEIGNNTPTTDEKTVGLLQEEGNDAINTVEWALKGIKDANPSLLEGVGEYLTSKGLTEIPSILTEDGFNSAIENGQFVGLAEKISGTDRNHPLFGYLLSTGLSAQLVAIQRLFNIGEIKLIGSKDAM